MSPTDWTEGHIYRTNFWLNIIVHLTETILLLETESVIHTGCSWEKWNIYSFYILAPKVVSCKTFHFYLFNFFFYKGQAVPCFVWDLMYSSKPHEQPESNDTNPVWDWILIWSRLCSLNTQRETFCFDDSRLKSYDHIMISSSLSLSLLLALILVLLPLSFQLSSLHQGRLTSTFCISEDHMVGQVRASSPPPSLRDALLAVGFRRRTISGDCSLRSS